MNTPNWLSFSLSFFSVLALLGLVLFILKKMQSKNLLVQSKKNIKLIDTLSIGPRQKIILLEIKNQEILLGVTVNNINTLSCFNVENSKKKLNEISEPNENNKILKSFSEIISSKINSKKEN